MARRKSAIKVTSGSNVPENKIILALQTTISLTALSSTIFVTAKFLEPLFGSVATNLYLQTVAGATIILLTVIPLSGVLGTWRETVLSGQLFVAPCTLHWLATLTTQLGNPVLGPILAYLPVLFSIVFSAIDVVRDILASQKLLTQKAVVSIMLSMFTLQSQPLWSYIPFNKSFGHPMLLLVIGWIVVLSGQLTARFSATATRNTPKFHRSTFILPLFLTLFALLQPPLRVRSMPYTHPNGQLRILSSTPSVTGRIVVGEDHLRGFRFLRADHSLLGGVWINEKYLIKMDGNADFVRDKDGRTLGESIYSAFILQEAARLQEREKPHQNALIIGLGVGIATQAFVQHGLSTSIVEIDPAVYQAARDYFGVPEPAAVYIEDARGWVERQASLNNGTYDIVVHDVFSGGSVPAHLFTSEFWQNLKKILSPDGIIAVNYAGVIGSESSKAVYLTLSRHFRQCRVFHDYKTQVPEDQLTSEFINLVYFCSPSQKLLTFRAAMRSDYLSSYLRDHVLRELPEREVPVELILSGLPQEREAEYVLTDEYNPLGAWQDRGALDHWKVMRSVLPDYIWSTY